MQYRAYNSAILHYVLAKSRYVSFVLFVRQLYLAHVLNFVRDFLHHGLLLFQFDILLTALPSLGQIRVARHLLKRKPKHV